MNISKKIFYQSSTITPLGEMIAIADNSALHILHYADTKTFSSYRASLISMHDADMVEQRNDILENFFKELNAYFAGTSTSFKTSLAFQGSTFSVDALNKVNRIPYGHTASYKDVAATVGNARAFRAVARANATNKLAIVIPCHRVIGSNGKLQGYNGGLERKQWLLDHERKYTHGS